MVNGILGRGLFIWPKRKSLQKVEPKEKQQKHHFPNIYYRTGSDPIPSIIHLLPKQVWKKRFIRMRFASFFVYVFQFPSSNDRKTREMRITLTNFNDEQSRRFWWQYKLSVDSRQSVMCVGTEFKQKRFGIDQFWNKWFVFRIYSSLTKWITFLDVELWTLGQCQMLIVSLPEDFPFCFPFFFVLWSSI